MRLVSVGVIVGFVLSGLTANASPISGQRPAGTKDALGLTPEKAAKDYSVQQIAASVPGNVLWPKDEATFTLQFVNKTDKDVVLLVVGDRTPFDEVTYPDIDLHGKAGADGRFVFTKKDGTPH